MNTNLLRLKGAAAALILTATPALARQEILQGVTFNVDTVAHYYIGPGVTHTRLLWTRADGTSRSFSSYSIDIDRTAPGADKVRPKVEIGNDQVRNAERVSDIAARKTTDDAQYIAAMNGDFFITSAFSAQHEMGNQILGYPNMTCAIDGMLAAPDIIDIASRENALILGTDGQMWIDATDMRYRILNNDGSAMIGAYAVNYPRKADQLVLYNRFNGTSTRTDDTGRELVLRRVDGQPADRINKSTKYEVADDWRQGGDTAIPDDGYVISAGPQYSHSKYNDWLNSLKKGDIIKVRINCDLPAFENLRPEILEICGGDVRILNNNVVTTEAIRWINTPSSLYSRTLVGYSQDRNHLVYCCVDASDGMGGSGISYFEGADLMRALGCWDALDLDGGGSTAMWTPTHGFLNHLRDGSERAVGNGLFVRMDTPRDPAIASIRFADWAVTLPEYGQYVPVIYGYNKYGQLVNTAVDGYTLSAPAEMGYITPDGKSLMAEGTGTYALKATVGDMECTIPVTVTGSAEASVRCPQVLLDGHYEYTVEIETRMGDKIMAISPLAYSWTSSDPSVATVDADGHIRGIADGHTVITGTRDDRTLTVNVTVEIPRMHSVSLLGTPDDWTVTKSGLGTTPVLQPAADGGFDIGYNVTSTRSPNFTMSRVITLWSRPDQIEFNIDGGDKPVRSVLISLQPAYAAKAVSVTTTLGENRPVTIPLTDIRDIDWTRPDAFPLTLSSVRVQLKTGAAGEGKLRFGSLNAVYNTVDAAVSDISADPDAGQWPAEYYTIQGQRIHSPQPGTLVIERRGPHARKIVVR